MIPAAGVKRPREAVRVADEPALSNGDAAGTSVRDGKGPGGFSLDAVFGTGTDGSTVIASEILSALPQRRPQAGRARRVVGNLFSLPSSTTNVGAEDHADGATAGGVVTTITTKEAAAAKDKYLDSLLKNDPTLAVLTPFEQEKALDAAYLHTLEMHTQLVAGGIGRIAASTLLEKTDATSAQKADAAVLGSAHGSMLLSLFGSGVAEVDPVDVPFLSMPKYDAPLVDGATMTERIGRMHHPVPPIEGSVFERELANPDVFGPAPIRLAMTPAERKKEKHAKRLEKRNEHQQKVQSGEVEEQQKLTTKHLTTVLKDQFQANAVGTENKINEEKEQRILEHLKANHDAHMAALPHQIEKRERDLWNDAERDPSLCVFRLFPIREEMTLHTFAKFANDHKMRGFILHIAKRDAVIVMVGGPAPMRHVTNWITGRMQWRESADTKSALVYSTRVAYLDRFSFHEKKTPAGVGDGSVTAGASGEPDSVFDRRQERTYLKSVATLAEAFAFMVDTMPTDGPWPSLEHLWHVAMSDLP